MEWTPRFVIRWLFDSEHGPRNRFLSRWILLRALGLIYFSAFFSLLFQIRGLIGPQGILPASEFLQQIAEVAGHARFWYAPSLLWISSGSHMLLALCWVGMAAAVLLVLNLWPRGMLVICFVCFLSFVSASGEFSGYQSDGMLLEAGFIALFFVPGGLRPGLGETQPPVRASWLLLLWEWFRIYFESGVAKIASGDPEWRHFTAMDEYYQNGPLPTWIGWYAQHLPHWFHAATAFGTLALELVLIWTAFLPRKFRIALFFVVTPWQMGIILTANYTFLNYLVLVLAFLLLDDQFLARFLPKRWGSEFRRRAGAAIADSRVPEVEEPLSILQPAENSAADASGQEENIKRNWLDAVRPHLATAGIAATAVMLGWLFYSTVAQLIWMFLPGLPLPTSPVAALEPFRVADRYGLFAVMTRGRYEIEFQGSNDGQNWVAYPFRFKPQDPSKAPGIYAPYQPRFDWNLWFASLSSWREDPIVLRTERKLLEGDADVLALFAGNPFPKEPPKQIRAVLWQYWFTSWEEKKEHGTWWKREQLGLYAPSLEREPDGRIAILAWPSAEEPKE